MRAAAKKATAAPMKTFALEDEALLVPVEVGALEERSVSARFECQTDNDLRRSRRARVGDR